MAKGKFSAPRPYREEDRQIEQAYRQVTSQKSKTRTPRPEEPEALSLFPEQEAAPRIPKNRDTAPLPEIELSQAAPSGFQESLPDEMSEADLFAGSDPAEDFFEAEEGEDFSEEGGSFLDTLLDFCEKIMVFCSRNKKAVLVGICAAALVLIVSIISVFFASTADPYDRKILNNVYVAGVNLGGMTKQEAVNAVKQATSYRYAQEDMLIEIAGTTLRLSAGDVSAKLNAKNAVNAAYDYGRTGTNAEKEQAYQNSLYGSYTLPLSPYLELNERRIRDRLEVYAEEAGNTLTQTKYGLEGLQPELSADKLDENAPTQTLVITMGTPGVEFDVSEVLDLILAAYDRYEFQVTVENVEPSKEPDPLDLNAVYEEFYIAPVDASVPAGGGEPIPAVYGYGFDMDEARKLLEQAGFGQEIRIPMVYIEPEILENELHFQDILGEYKTSYTWNKDRCANMELACSAINGIVLDPGESFSFNDALGKRTTERGYRFAYTDPAGDEEPVVGGGVTQVSSTLYYCALLSEMKITARHSHGYPLSFMDYGMDADAVWGQKDLKFSNSTDYPVRIEAQASEGYVTVRLLGTDQRDHYVRLENRIQNTYVPDTEYKEFDYDNKEGYRDGDVIQEGRSGFHVKSFLLKFDRNTNELISRDEIADSRYKTVNEILARIKTEPTTEPTVAPTETPTTQPSTEAPTTQATTQPTTQATTEAATEATTQPAATQAASEASEALGDAA